MRAADEFSGVGGPADGGVFAESEDGGQVQRVGAGGDGFFELPVKKSHIPARRWLRSDEQELTGEGPGCQVVPGGRI
ncbi:hypothetical protein [Micromonospora sp. NPDC005806]|uniref:hypothetical protein n=1 Tax=Micromonospora sp. NPDC005806 TaxID=3364234 RepID=UPI00367A8D7F